MYRGKRRKVNFISDIFTVSDEACAVLMMIKYLERWKMMAAEPDKKKYKDRLFNAKFTSSRKGTKTNWWSDKGKETFNKWCFRIHELRKKENSGRMVKELTRNHFIGESATLRAVEHQVVTFDVFEEESWTEGIKMLPV